MFFCLLQVPLRAEEITIPADVTPEKVPTHIVDYSGTVCERDRESYWYSSGLQHCLYGCVWVCCLLKPWKRALQHTVGLIGLTTSFMFVLKPNRDWADRSGPERRNCQGNCTTWQLIEFSQSKKCCFPSSSSLLHHALLMHFAKQFPPETLVQYFIK